MYAKVRGIIKFKAEYFEADECGFHNLLSQKKGTSKAELRYVIRGRVTLAVLPYFVTEQMYQIWLTREAFGEYNWTVLHMLREYLISSPGWAWIEQFNATENEREAFWAWSDHYSGQVELRKRIHLALATLKILYYKKD